MPKISLTAKNVILVAVSLLQSLFVNFCTSAYYSRNSGVAYGFGCAIVATFVLQLIVVLMRTFEEDKLQLLSDAQDVKFRAAIAEAQMISEMMVRAIADGDHSKGVSLHELRTRIGR
jgi:magnesium-transporting ATPase (P-type)